MSSIENSNSAVLDRRRVVTELLHRDRPSTPVSVADRPLMARRLRRLEEEAPTEVETARQLGVEIEFLGIERLFAEPRYYRGVDSDWVLGPANKSEDAVVPAKERKALGRLVGGGHNFDLIYIAHEIPTGAPEGRATIENAPVTIDPARAAELVGPVPPPAQSVALGERLARRSNQVVHAVARTVPAVGAAALAVAAAPVVLVGAAVGALATLDPIVLGAVPAFSARPSEPAAFYVLARWDW
jgi:hypothetical protein